MNVNGSLTCEEQLVVELSCPVTSVPNVGKSLSIICRRSQVTYKRLDGDNEKVIFNR